MQRWCLNALGQHAMQLDLRPELRQPPLIVHLLRT